MVAERIQTPLFSPRFGPLSGMRVLLAGSIVAGPTVGILLGDLGAEVIHIERPVTGDVMRLLPPLYEADGKKIGGEFVCVRRNELSVTLNIKSDEGKKIFYELIKQSDIFIENLVWLEERYGIRDGDIFRANPKIVIVHVSGYGRPEFGGDPEKCKRGSYDIISQAYSGWCRLASTPEYEVYRLPLYAGDYVTALFGVIGALAAYVHAQKTGEGQVVDIAQFEANARIIEMYHTMYYNLGVSRAGEGVHRVFNQQPYGLYKAKDGWVAIGAVGPITYKRFMKALSDAAGINPEDFPYEECSGTPEAISSSKGRELDRTLGEYLKNHMREEVEEDFNKYNVPCSRVSTPDDVLEDEHWLKRGDIVDVLDLTTGTLVKQIGIVPKFSKTPGKIWKGVTKLGEDTKKVLKHLVGLSEEEIKQLKEEGIIDY
jgi:crotonobetainyl-CoA:carnitine CoA-transferase CaiB-like acyl-CoA transferase